MNSAPDDSSHGDTTTDSTSTPGHEPDRTSGSTASGPESLHEPDRPIAPATRRRSWRKPLIAALPVALLIGGSYAWVTGGRYISTEDAYVQQNRVSVVPQVSGQIASMKVRENDTVKAGQVLFTLDDAIYRNAVDADRAKLESARLEVQKLKAAYEVAASDANTAQDALTTTQAQSDRETSLRASGAISQSDADQSTLRLQRAQGALSRARSQVLAARAALAGKPDIAVDEHPAVLQAKAELAAAELDLAHTRITAPESGIVSQSDRLQVGQYVTPSTPVLSLVETHETWIEANYKETDLTNMRAGQPVTVELDTYAKRPMQGVIGSIGAGTGSEFALLPAQNASGNWVKVVQRVPVRIRLTDADAIPGLRAGMSASVEVDTGHSRGMPTFATDVLAAIGIGAQPAMAAETDSPAADR